MSTDVDWRESAACRDHLADLWFPGKGTSETAWNAPRAICQACPVKDLCLQAALDNGETHGMFGGLTPDERRRLAAPRTTGRPLSARCGTNSGHTRHRRLGEKPCAACAEANRAYNRDHYARKVAG